MDQAEAKTLGLEFKDVMALEASGIDIGATKKLIVGLIEHSQVKLEKSIKDEYDKKLKDMNNNMSKMTAKLQPVSDLTQNGKSLPMAILDYILSGDGVASIIEKAKSDIIGSDQMKVEFVTFDKLQRLLNDMTQNFSEINMQISEFQSIRKQFMFDVGNLKNQLSEYVHQNDLEIRLREVSRQMESFAPWDSVRKIYYEFEGYFKLTEFQGFQ